MVAKVLSVTPPPGPHFQSNAKLTYISNLMPSLPAFPIFGAQFIGKVTEFTTHAEPWAGYKKGSSGFQKSEGGPYRKVKILDENSVGKLCVAAWNKRSGKSLFQAYPQMGKSSPNK